MSQDPIPMILHCPRCHMQHVDAPESEDMSPPNGNGVRVVRRFAWANPPHKSHLCHGCGFVWRPADVPTAGVLKIQTKGQRDSIDYTKDIPEVVQEPNPEWVSSALRKSASSTLSKEELFEQRVSWVSSMMGDRVSKDLIRERLRDMGY